MVPLILLSSSFVQKGKAPEEVVEAAIMAEVVGQAITDQEAVVHDKMEVGVAF